MGGCGKERQGGAAVPSVDQYADDRNDHQCAQPAEDGKKGGECLLGPTRCRVKCGRFGPAGHLFAKLVGFDRSGRDFPASEQVLQFTDEGVHVGVAIFRVFGKDFEQNRFNLLRQVWDVGSRQGQGFCGLLEQNACGGIGGEGFAPGDHFVEYNAKRIQVRLWNGFTCPLFGGHVIGCAQTGA